MKNILSHKVECIQLYFILFYFVGSTGFLGKILVEKLLRSCPDISTMYLLIRPKKNKSFESRLDEIFENSVSAEQTVSN